MSIGFVSKFLSNNKQQIVFLGAVIFLLYARTLSFEFIGLDEQSLLIEKKNFNSELSNIPGSFSHHVFYSDGYIEAPGTIKFYRPLLSVSFILNQFFSKDSQQQNTASGKGFGLFHFTNILFHFIAVIGLLFVLLRLAIQPSLSFFFALLFAVHPLLTQAIAWIPGRNDSLVCAFILWSFYFLLTYCDDFKQKNLFLHLLFFTAALFTKENAIVFPLLCFMVIFFIQGKKLKLNTKLFLALYYILLGAFWFYARTRAVGEINSDLSFSSLYYSLLKNFPLILQYFQKTILPVNLAVMASVDDTNYGWVFLTLLLFGAGIYFTKKIPWHKILFGLAWFFLFLLPTLLFSYFEGMEHRTYLPAVGILIAVSFLEPVQNLSKKINSMTGFFGSVILIFFCVTFFRLPVFSNELNYWKNAYETSEHSAVVCRDYGVILTKTGDFSSAEKVYLEGLRRNPKETLVHYNLGIMYFRAQRFGQAKEQLLQELEINSRNFMVYYVMGIIYKQENKVEQAVPMWEEAVKLNPKSAESYKELLAVYSQKQDTANFIRCRTELGKLGFKIINKRN